MSEEKAVYKIEPLKTVVYIERTTSIYINSVTTHGVKSNTSMELNRAIEELNFIYKNLIPEEVLNDETFWSVVSNVYAGSGSQIHVVPIDIVLDIMNCYNVTEIEDLDKYEKLAVKKASVLSKPVQMAVIHLIRKFWARSYDYTDKDTFIETIRKINNGVDYDF